MCKMYHQLKCSSLQFFFFYLISHTIFLKRRLVICSLKCIPFSGFFHNLSLCVYSRIHVGILNIQGIIRSVRAPKNTPAYCSRNGKVRSECTLVFKCFLLVDIFDLLIIFSIYKGLNLF